MKKESISKKLRFKKVFVANLSKNDQTSVFGGEVKETEIICDRTWCSLDHTCAVGCEKQADTAVTF